MNTTKKVMDWLWDIAKTTMLTARDVETAERIAENERLRQAWDEGISIWPVETAPERFIIALRDAIRGDK